MKIIKRDGTEVDFNVEKIYNAIMAANTDVPILHHIDSTVAWEFAHTIEEKCKHLPKTPTVEQVQDEVEYILMEGYPVLAKAYITYRYKRAAARDNYHTFISAITDKLEARNVQNQNANIDEKSFGGRIGEATDVMMKNYALNYCLSPLSRMRHENNEIYIHDLSHYAVGDHNCLSIPFDDLLAKGFNTRQIDIRPAQSINTAMQLIAVIFQLQSLMQFGGVSSTHLDWTMVPYVRKSFYKHYKDGLNYIAWDGNNAREPMRCFMRLTINPEEISIYDNIYKTANMEAPYKCVDTVYKYALDMTEKELYQAVEGMYHNLNTLQSRSGNQLPFSSINYGTCTLPEGRMVIKALLDTSIKGLGKLHRTSIFPCGIFQCMKGVNRKPGDPNYDLFQLALKSTSLRLYPNYANVDWSGNAGYDPADPRTYFSTMGCRTANLYDINGLGQLKDGRGNICPVTIILPTIAMEALKTFDKGNDYKDTEQGKQQLIDYFLRCLDQKINDAKDMLIERFEYICKQSPDSAKFMYENGLMAGYDGKDIRSALKHGTLAMGMLGMAETLELLIGKNHTTKEGMELAKRICALYKQRCAEFKRLYSLNFAVYFTPAENLCHTALEKFREKYGIIPKVSDREYFTNSTHIPVWEEVNIFEKIDLESQLTGYSSAGCITYVELDATCKNNIKALEDIVNYAMDKDIPYFALNVPNDTCLNCGYTDELNDTCPECESHDIQRLRRVTGYLTGNYTTAFNKGKIAETEDRFKHSQK